MKIRFLICLLLFNFTSCSKDDIIEDTVIYVSAVTIEGTNITQGTTSQLTASIAPANATNKTVLWSVSDNSIAEISQNGLLTAKKNGTVAVSARAQDRGTVIATKQFTISSFPTTPPNQFTVSNASELYAELLKAKAGVTIILNPGTYTMTSKITLSVSGTAENNIVLIAQSGQGRPKLDFSAMPENSSNQGIVLSGSYWHIKGIDIYKAGDNGMQIKGNNNLIEFCTFSECFDTGLQLDSGASNNTILNCDSYFNADSTLENADGFACKLSAGTGNKFIGCRAWQNLDDGWDGYLRGADNIETTYENCWSIKNGYLKNGTLGTGDGNGFKTGGSDDKLLKHNATYLRCLAVGNSANGFDHNSNRGTVTIYHGAAYNNGKKNYSFNSTNPLTKLTIKNSNSLGGGTANSFSAQTTDVTYNAWQNGIITDANDFKSLDLTQLIQARKTDGSLPDVTFMNLVPGSDLIDKGINLGLPFNGSAPDLGAFEF